MLPGEDGFTLCAAFTKRKIPVIFLTAKTVVQDRVYGLQLGAEDYILKPFEPAELLARIEVILRRTGKPNDQDALLPNRIYEDLLIGSRAALLDTLSEPRLYAIADPLTTDWTLLTIRDVGDYAVGVG